MSPNFWPYAMSTGLFLLSLPLWRGWVPINRFYGFRTQFTMSSDAIWLQVNHWLGLYLMVASVAAAAAFFLVQPLISSGRDDARILAGVALNVTAIGIALFLVALKYSKINGG